MNRGTISDWLMRQVKKAFPDATNVVVMTVAAIFWAFLLGTIYAMTLR